MDIITAGTSIAIGVKNFMFSYTKTEYQKKINELDRLIERLNNHLENLVNLRDRIPSFWEDEDAQKTIKTLDITIQKVRNNMSFCQSLSETFKKTVDELDGSKEVLGGLLEDALGALSSISD